MPSSQVHAERTLEHENAVEQQESVGWGELDGRNHLPVGTFVEADGRVAAVATWAEGRKETPDDGFVVEAVIEAATRRHLTGARSGSVRKAEPVDSGPDHRTMRSQVTREIIGEHGLSGRVWPIDRYPHRVSRRLGKYQPRELREKCLPGHLPRMPHGRHCAWAAGLMAHPKAFAWRAGTDYTAKFRRRARSVHRARN